MGPVSKILMLIGASALATTTALAADFPSPPPPQPYVPPPVVEAGGWYLRGDVGVGRQTFTDFSHFQTNDTFVWPASWRIDQSGIGDSAFVGFGAGYAWNNWFRFDVTGEYRAKAKVKVLGSYTEFCTVGDRCFDLYDGDHSAWLFMANAYIDLGTWWCVTPFVGAGIGTAYTSSTNFTDIGFITGPGTTGFGYQQTEYNKWNMAWALHAGLTYHVSNTFKVELAYRYLNMGDVRTGIIDCAGVGCGSASSGPRAYYTMTDFTSQDIKLGLRWMLQPEVVAPPQPVYSPPPPLMRRG